ncbi:MAG: amidohydrolase family protein [Thermoleophilia bacterium]
MTGEGPSDKAGADLILLNGNVIPVALPNKREQALAISRGRIIAVGPTRTIEQLRRSTTEVVDLAGRTVLPGFIDSHVHFFLTAASYRSAQLDEAGSIAEVCRLVGEQAAKIPPGEWVYGFNCPAWTIGRLPTMDELDAVSGDHPVYVASDSFHSGAANSKAIALLAPPETLRQASRRDAS